MARVRRAPLPPEPPPSDPADCLVAALADWRGDPGRRSRRRE